MNKIVSREVLNSETVMLDIEAPAIARKRYRDNSSFSGLMN